MRLDGRISVAWVGVLLVVMLACAARAEVSAGAELTGWSTNSEITPMGLPAARPLTLEPGSPELVFFFRAAGAGAETHDTLFRYRLRGFTDDWTETREQVAYFWKLPPGSYDFQVQARLPGGVWPTAVAAFPVRQKPFFYQTWYAGVMVCVVALAIGAQLLRQRDQLLKGQIGMVLEERNRIASECHDTLMAGFAAVSWQLEATADMLTDHTPDQRAVAGSLEMARSMVSHCQAEARRIIWDLRNSDRITTRLSEALADAILSHRLHDGAETTLDVRGEEVALSPSAVHHLVCIGQEAMTNAMRHARPSLIQVQLQFEADCLCLSIKDDGCGFAAQDGRVKAGHFGIPVMEERARKLGGNFKLTTSSDRGTEVSVTVNFRGIQQLAVQQATVVPWIGL